MICFASFFRRVFRVKVDAAVSGIRSFALCLLLFSTPAQAQNLSLDIDDFLGGAGSGLGLPIGIDIGAALDPELTRPILSLDVSIPSGFVLRDIACPGGVSVSGSGASLSLAAGEGTTTLADCVLEIVNVVAASAVAVPIIQQRNNMLLSVELGLGQQLDRFGTGGDASEAFPKPAGLGGSAGMAGFGPDSGTRMGLMTTGESRDAPLAFATSLQQMKRTSAPYKLGATAVPASPVSRTFNIWTEGYLAHVETDDRYGSSDGRAGVIFAGADYLVSDRLLLGMLVQYDDQDRKFDGAPLRFSDQGWLAGPYAVVRLTDTLFFQGRAAWGQSQNSIEVDQAFDDSFDSDRWLVKGRLLANLRSGSWLVRPSASIAYVEDDLEAYTSSSGVKIGQRSLSLGQMKFGPEIAYSFPSYNGFVITPSLTLEGIWNFDRDDSGQGFDDLMDTSAVRGRIEAGTTVQSFSGVSLGLAATYDGIGTSDFTAIGGRARLTVPLD